MFDVILLPTSYRVSVARQLLRVPEHINLALQAKRIYSGSLWQNYCQMHPNPNPTFQKNVKQDGYFYLSICFGVLEN